MEGQVPAPVSLTGELGPEAIDTIFERIRAAAEPCRLRVWDERDEKVFLFTAKGIRLFHFGARRSDRLGQILVQHGRLRPSNLEELLALARANGKPIGEVGVELGLLTEQDIAAATKQQMEVHLSDLHFWQDARYEFVVGDATPPDDQGLQEFVTFTEIAEVLEGAAWRYRRWQSVRNVIRSEYQVFVRTALDAEELEEGEDDVAARILSFVDGERQVRDVVRESNISALKVYEVLRNAVIEGRIKKQGQAVLGTQTRRDELLDEIRVLEADRKERPYDTDLLSRVSDRYLALGEKDLAAKRLRELARVQLRGEAQEDALQSLQRASQCLPLDYDIREQILDVYSILGWERKLVEEGCDLGNLYFKRNLLDRGRSLLGHLVYLAPREPRIRKLYALTLLGLGQKQLALWQLNELAKVLEEVGAPDGERREVYRQILALDRKSPDVRKKLAFLGARGSRVWLKRTAIGTAAVLLVVVCSLVYFERLSAGEALLDPSEIEELVLDNRFGEARRAAEEARAAASNEIIRGQLEQTLAWVENCEREYLSVGLPTDLELAGRLEEEGEIGRALAIYDRVARLDPESHELVGVAMSKREELSEAERIAESRVGYGRELLARDQRKEAHAAFVDAIRLFPRSTALRDVRLPLRLKCVPASAEVFVDGVRVAGSTPAQVDYRIGPNRAIVLEKEGFEDLVIPVAGPLPEEKNVQLQKVTKWMFRTSAPIEGAPVVVDGVAYVGGRDRYVRAIRLADGREVARAALGVAGDVESGPVAVGGRLFVGTAAGEVIAFETGTLRELWRGGLDGVAITGLDADPDRGRAYAAREDGHLLALDFETGERLWEVAASVTPGTSPEITGSGRVLVTSRVDRMLLCYEAEGGSRAWTVEFDERPTTGVHRRGDRVVVGCADGTLFVLGAELGEERLRHQHTYGIRVNPCLTEDRVYYAAADGTLRALLGDGSGEAFSVSAQSGLPVGAAAAGDEVYVSWSRGVLQCIDRGTGTTLWLHRTPGGIASEPVVAGDLVLVTTLEGAVLAVER